MMNLIMALEEINTSSITKINKHFRNIDESDLYPINGRFNVTERAIRKLRIDRRDYIMDNYEYYLALEQSISDIVNGAT